MAIDERFGYIDKTGNFLLEPLYGLAGYFSEGLGYVRNDNKWGYINEEGRYLVDPRFDWAEDFVNGFARVNIGGSIDDRVNIEEKQDDISFVVGGKWGFLAPDGSYLVEPRYEWVDEFHEGKAVVSIGFKYGYR